MAGIYIHIPFCKKACHYCNFHFSTTLNLQNDIVKALIKEIKLQKEFLGAAKIETIYFGGGTPSILSTTEIQQILKTIIQNYSISEHPEITLEANPDDLTSDKLASLKSIGINRLSIGIQSFHEQDLVWMNRSHNVQQAKDCIHDAQSIGFDNISIDLIFGSNTTTPQMWLENLEQATAYGVLHISAYSLTVEKGTALQHVIAKGKEKALDSALGAEQFKMTSAFLADCGYEHYEISNYAKQQKYSRHNTNYWKQVPYLGIGPAAHSYKSGLRQWNIAHNAKYLEALEKDSIPATTEILSKEDVFNEYIMTGLRTIWGCNKSQLDRLYPEWSTQLAAELSQLIETNQIHETKETITLTREGRLIADTIISQLFLTS